MASVMRNVLESALRFEFCIILGDERSRVLTRLCLAVFLSDSD